MMFEVEDLVYASPATVSRCGMVYLEAKNLGWETLIQSYIKEKLPETMQQLDEVIKDEMIKAVDCVNSFVKKNGKFPMPISEM